jgi:hypothetical protein
MRSSSEPPTLQIKKSLEKLTGFQFDLHFKPGRDMKICDFLSRSHDPNDKPGSRIRPIAMTDLAKTWAQGVHDQMIEENDLEDEIDLPAPIRRTSFSLIDEETEEESTASEDSEFFLDSEVESDQAEDTDVESEYFGISDSDRLVTRSMGQAPKPTTTIRSDGPTTRSQAKVSGNAPMRSAPTPPKVTKTNSSGNKPQTRQTSCGPRVTPNRT